MKQQVVLTAILSLCACGGDSAEDLVGIYQVSTSTTNPAACDVEGDPTPDAPPYIRLRKEEFFGQELLAYGDCDGPTDAECTDAGLFRSFIRQDGEWIYQVTSSSGGGDFGDCLLSYTRGAIEDLGDGTIRIEIRAYSEVDATLSQDQCSLEEAEQRGEDMPCSGYEVVVAAKVMMP